MASLITVLSLLALSGGLLGYFTFPAALRMGIKSSINLAENGMVYPLYMNPPFPTRSEFYLFAIENPRQVLRGDKMEFRLKGPFVYRTNLERDGIKFSKNKDKVRYNSRRRLYLNERESGQLDEQMWLINPILPSMLKSIKLMLLDRVPFRRLSEPIVLRSVNLLLDNYKERLIARTTPRAFLQGKTVELLESISGLAARFGLSSLVPPGPPDNKFGLAFAQNETVEQLEIFTGIGPSSSERFAEVSLWKDQAEVTAWRGKCRTINGTNGELYKPLVNEAEPISIFLGPLCRSFQLEPVLELGDDAQDHEQMRHKQVVTSTGIRALVYEFSPSLYMGARNNPANRCFCEDPRTYDCQFDGLLSMGPCFFDAPLYFARANLKGVDERIAATTRYRTSVTETLPEGQNFALEKNTGTVLAVNLSLMGLFKVVKQAHMRDIEGIQNLTYVPAFATTESFELPFEYSWQIYLLQKANDYHAAATLATASSGAVLLIAKRLLPGSGAAVAAAA